MPEGPEIRRVADALSRALAGQIAREVRIDAQRFPHLQAAAARLRARRVIAVMPRGKALLTRFSGGWTIYSHNQLYGEWQVFRAPPPPTHLKERLLIRTDRRWAVLYSASEIEVIATCDEDRHPYIARLGIELLEPATKPAGVLAQVAAPRFARRPLAVSLLDQGFLAGVGNYLRSEILFVAGLRPEQRPADLDDAAQRRLARAALTLTRRAYRTGGITHDPRAAAVLKARGEPFAALRHWVFDRAGLPCRMCGTRIARVIAAGRPLFLCEHCQTQRPLTSTRNA
jgi:endonuclease-8